MSEHIDGAAERMRRWYKAVESGCRHTHEYACRDEGSAMLARDESTLVDAYLDEHANDDENATPLTEEILEASGWEPPVYYGWWLQGCEFGLSPATRTVDSCKVFGMVSGQTGDVLGYIETVGDLRKLLEALHIPAVVVVPKGGSDEHRRGI